MKQKRILITYLNNGNLQSQVAKEYLFNRVVAQLEAEGRTVAQTMVRPTEKRVKFQDGSDVVCVPFSMANRGMKVTHVFVDEVLSNLSNGDEIVTQCLMSVINWETKEFDTSEKDRAFTFNYQNGTLNLKNI